MIVEPMTDAELDGLRSKIFAYNRKERSRLRLFGQNVIRILARLDAERTRADAAEAERDAAVARAMPEPRLLRTVEDVEALPEGHYFFNIPDRTFWTAVEKDCDDTWWMLGNECRVRPANLADSFYCIGPLPLPDLPTPTAGEPR